MKKIKIATVTTQHPLLVGLALVKNRNGLSARHIAQKHLGVTQQAVHEWMVKARKNRNFQVPPRRVPALCKLTGQAPHLYSPVLWPDASWRFK
jgi:hypothetical protein